MYKSTAGFPNGQRSVSEHTPDPDDDHTETLTRRPGGHVDCCTMCERLSQLLGQIRLTTGFWSGPEELAVRVRCWGSAGAQTTVARPAAGSRTHGPDGSTLMLPRKNKGRCGDLRALLPPLGQYGPLYTWTGQAQLAPGRIQWHISDTSYHISTPSLDRPPLPPAASARRPPAQPHISEPMHANGGGRGGVPWT